MKTKAIVKFILSDDKNTTLWLQADSIDAMNTLISDCVRQGFWTDTKSTDLSHSTGCTSIYVGPNNILRAEVKLG